MDTTTLLMIALFVALGYFMLVRPARQQQKKQAALMSELEPGSRVSTQIGVYGTLLELGDVQARLEVSPGVVLTIDKRLISGVTPRSRDEFWTYPEEAAEDGDRPVLADGPDQVGGSEALAEGDVESRGVQQSEVDRSEAERPYAASDDAGNDGLGHDRTVEGDVEQGFGRDARTDGPDERKA